MPRFLLALLPVVALLVGCALHPTIRVELKEYSITPALIQVKAGTIVRLEVVNWGRERHDLYIEGVDQATYRLKPLHYEVLEFQAPTQPGIYRMLCTEPGHADRNMVGQLIVIK